MEPIIQANELNCRFGSIQAVKDLSLSVNKGHICGFLGQNGAGKTTTIRILLGLIRPQSGRCEVFGLPPGHIDALKQIGSMVESPSLYDHLTGKENVEVTRIMRNAPRSETERVLDYVGLRQDANRTVNGYSMGMRQRLGLALTLIGNPQLLILDEPTNGLDPAGIHEIRELIRNLPREVGATVFLSSHLLAEIEQIADDVIVIHRGQLRYQGPLNELGNQGAQIKIRVDQPQKALGILSKRNASSELIDKHIYANIQEHEIPTVIEDLVQQGIQIYEITPKHQNLESRFLELIEK